MRSLLAIAALGVIIFLGLGWYLGWYQVHTVPGGSGKIEIDVDTNKIKSDVGAGENKLHDFLTPAKSANPQSSTNSPSTNPPSTNATISFRAAEDGSFVFPAPTPPGGGATLPAPR